jgi:hypothetical protein
MRKVMISITTIAVLTVALTLPVAAASPYGRNCNKSLNWGRFGAPAITQPTNCPTVRPVKGETDISKLGLNQIFQLMGSRLGNCFNGLFGN